MSERKRAELNTFEPQKVSDKVNKKESKTIRITVVLPEPNEDLCPEFNYKDELAAAKKRLKPNKEPNNIENGLDPFGNDDDDDVRRIALQMEAKYGTGMAGGGKKKRKGRKDDYADIGMGYDESDSFIDNTDGYDEIVPQNVTTLHGGFYINCGALEFKTDEEASSEVPSSSSDSEVENKPSVNRKRILESSDTESDAASTSQAEKDPKLSAPKNTMQQAIKKKLFSPNKIQVKKRRLLDPLKKTVKELLREKREDLNMSLPVELEQTEHEDTAEKDSLKENKKPMNISSVTDAIESVVKQVGDNFDKNLGKPDMEESRKSDLSTSKTDTQLALEGDSSQEAYTVVDRADVKLPENLPADILDLIIKIKRAAVNYKEQGKKKFFTDEVNTMLLNLERMCKILGKSSRVKVYEYLSVFIKCRRETLMRRAKILMLEDDEKRLRRLIVKLKDNIDRVMPALLQNYEQDSQQIIQKKFSKEGADSEEIKALKMPRRRFLWTDESRKLVKDIVSVKRRCLIVEGKQKDNLEELMSQYLRTEILPLWPDGWMYQNALKKVYNMLVEHTSDSSSLNDTNNSSLSKNVPHKKHSNTTIKPVPMPKSSTSKAQEDITFTKIVNREAKPAAKLADPNIATSQPSNYKTSSTNPVILVKGVSHMPKPKVIHPVSSVWNIDKVRHENHNYSKPDVEIEVVKPTVDGGVIVVSKQSDEKKICEPNTVIPKPAHCQLMDLTECKSELKRKADVNQPFMLLNEMCPTDLSKPSSRDMYAEGKRMSNSRPELSVSPTYIPSSIPKPPSKSEGDDIKMVMENLKALEMLSSPIKAENSASSPVSVIAYNKSFSPKSNSCHSSAGPRTDYSSKNDFSASAQEEFQKQFLKSLHQRPTSHVSSKLDFVGSAHEELQKHFNNAASHTRPASGSNHSKNDFAGSPQEEFQKQFIKSLQPLAAALSTTTKSNYNSGS